MGDSPCSGRPNHPPAADIGGHLERNAPAALRRPDRDRRPAAQLRALAHIGKTILLYSCEENLVRMMLQKHLSEFRRPAEWQPSPRLDQNVTGGTPAASLAFGYAVPHRRGHSRPTMIFLEDDLFHIGEELQRWWSR